MSTRRILPFVLVMPAILTLPGLTACCLAQAQTKPWQVAISPNNSLDFGIVCRGQARLGIALAGWGPRWSWKGFSAKDKAVDGVLTCKVPFVVDQAGGQVLDVTFQARQSGPRQVTLRYDLTARRDVPLTMLIASVNLSKSAGTITMEHEGGETSKLKLPLGRGLNPPAKRALLDLDGSGRVEMTFEPALGMAYDRDLRIQLAADKFPAGQKTATITMTFPDDVEFLASQADVDRLAQPLADKTWFAFEPASDLGPSVIGMEDWLEKPAGKRGAVKMVGDHFELGDGTRVKFWGANLSYGRECAPPKKDADHTAARFAKYGVNAVRLHKFSYPKNHSGIGEVDDCTKMTPDGLERLDYFSAQLKQRGIYFGWSHTFGFYVCPGNRSRLVAYDEIARALKGNTYSFIHFAPDVQDLMIEMVVNLLKHRNPHTGLTYAEEPALSFIELQNEDDIFFYTSEKTFNACPTYKKLFIQRFSDWLKQKYGAQDKLAAAWTGTLKTDETLASRNIGLQTNPWFFGQDHLPGQKGGSRQRLLDTAEFLHHVQNEFYGKFVKAIREAGYKGPLCGSPWQAPAMLPHYYNLYSDYLVGFIDRHNYFGGRSGQAQVSHPGRGYFSSGLQQVADRPFSLSEWITVYPSLHSADGPAIVAAYGLGLQGWDASYEFQSHAMDRSFADRAGWVPWGVWDADTPTQMGQYPALSRMVLGGDVKEAPVISRRRVAPGDFKTGTFSFSDRIAQEGDVKSFGGAVPGEALAAGRVVVEFVDKPQPAVLPDMSAYRKGSTIVSATGQLTWETADGGHIAVDTAGTKGVSGFAGGRTVKLGNVTIAPASPYASIFLTSLDQPAVKGPQGGSAARPGLDRCRSALLTAVARSCNSGFTTYAIDGRIIENGKGPILLEPVKATLQIQGRTVKAVNILDHDGRRTGRTLQAAGGRIEIDTGRDKALYYEIVFE